MPVAEPTVEIPQPAPDLRLLVELPPRPAVFLRNLRDFIFPERLPPLELESAPAAFWPDVFVRRELPWRRFADSIVFHALVFGALVAAAHLFALQPRVEVRPAFDQTQLIYDPAPEYLPPLDTRQPRAEQPRKADPEIAKQPIISVPREADNREQTLVAPPSVRLKHNVQMPNIVAWSDSAVKPRLDIPAVPLTPAAEITRLAPKLNSAVVAPPDARVQQQRNLPTLQTSVVAPPEDVHSTGKTFQALQPALIAPPPSVEASTRRVGDLNIGRAAVIAPAPQLAVNEQRAIPGGRSLTPQLIAPPPSLAAGPSAGSAAAGASRRTIALSLHPSVGVPSPPVGNRRGTFAAGPEGHTGASGAPGAATGNAGGSEAAGTKGKSGDMPAGLYVGKADGRASAMAGTSTAPANTVNPSLVANAKPPRVSSAPAKLAQPDSASRLAPAERAIFGDRKFYSLTLNMPNLNSAGGSWVIRFAEIKHDPRAQPAELSQPMATKKVDPAYPLQLMRENVAGTVILYAVIRADGSVGDVRVLRGVDDRIDRYASQAVTQWQFQPATKNGEPVDVEATFQIPFRPPKVGTNF